MAIPKPFNLTAWIEENRDLLKPPVGNKNLYVDSGDYIVMIVAGPNARKDYHYNETEELFYQLEGQITVRIQEDGQAVDMKLGPGDMYLHPAGVPHSPMREAGSLGLVIERKRKGTPERRPDVVLRRVQPQAARHVLRTHQHREGLLASLPRVLRQRGLAHLRFVRPRDGRRPTLCGLTHRCNLWPLHVIP